MAAAIIMPGYFSSRILCIVSMSHVWQSCAFEILSLVGSKLGLFYVICLARIPWSGCGAGSAPLKNSFRKAHQIEYLQKRAETIGQLDFLILTLVKRDKALKVEGLLTASPYSEQKIMSVLEDLIYKQRIVESGPWIFDADWWEQISEWALECVLTFHQKNPEKSGMPLTLFRKQLENYVPHSALFECIEISMESIGIKRMDDSIRHENHAATLPEKYIERARFLLKQLRSDPRNPPSRHEFEKDSEDRMILAFLLETREVVSLDTKTVMCRQAYEESREVVVAYLKQNERASVGQIREILGTSRRVLMPFLEHLDNDGVTVRNGDFRQLRFSG